jgi:hypothetical protein
MWSPISPAFSNSSTRNSSLPASLANCFSLMAAHSPAGPPPTMHTSTWSDSRSISNGLKSSSEAGVACRFLDVPEIALRWPAVTAAGW